MNKYGLLCLMMSGLLSAANANALILPGKSASIGGGAIEGVPTFTLQSNEAKTVNIKVNFNKVINNCEGKNSTIQLIKFVANKAPHYIDGRTVLSVNPIYAISTTYLASRMVPESENPILTCVDGKIEANWVETVQVDIEAGETINVYGSQVIGVSDAAK